MPPSLPARRADLVVQLVGKELLAYDPRTHQAHSLNRTAAAVFARLDGRSSAREIARSVAAEIGIEADERIVAAAVQRLSDAGLLEPEAAAGRRRVVKGLAAALVPAVASVLVPKPAAAASCGASGAPCATNGDCCSGYTCDLGAEPYPECVPSGTSV